MLERAGRASIFFFFQAEDGIRDYKVTGVQTCALPIFGKVPSARQQTDIGHSNDGQAVPTLGAHGAGRTVQADKMGGFAIRKIAPELAIFDDVSALRGNTFVIVGKRAEPRAVIEARIRDDIDDAGSVLQMIQLVERQEAGARK